MKPLLKGLGIAAGIAFLSILAVEPAHPQFGIDIAAILAGLKEVDSTLNSAVKPESTISETAKEWRPMCDQYW